MVERANERRAAAHRELDRLLDQVDQFSLSSEIAYPLAKSLMGQAAGFAALVCGAEIAALAYDEVVDPADRKAVLRQLAMRLDIARSLFDTTSRDEGPGSLAQAATEARAVAHGDEPILFARCGERKVPARVILAKCKALEWDAYLDGRGIPTFKRQAKIGEAFGHPWDTISRWSKQVEELTSANKLKYSLEIQRRVGMLESKSRAEIIWQPAAEQNLSDAFDIGAVETSGDNRPSWEARLEADGELYRRAMGFASVK